MKYTGLILGVIATICILFVTAYSVLTCQFGLAVVFAMMFILIGGITKIEYNELEKGGDQ